MRRQALKLCREYYICNTIYCVYNGIIEGVVNSISLISQAQKLEQGIINTYFVTVDLPQGLKTNCGEQLGFEYEMSGQADVIVKERRLIERLFDNLKNRTK